MGLNGERLINSDSSAELIMARLLNKTGGFVTDKWFYSTEIRVLHTQIIYKLALMIFPHNWHSARVFSIAIFLLIMIFATLFVAKEANLGTGGLRWCCAMIFPLGQWYAWNVIYNSHYVPCIVISLVSLGLILYFSKCKASRCKSTISICLMMILGLLSGLAGIRQLMMFYVPSFLAAFIMVKTSNQSEQNNIIILADDNKKKKRIFDSTFIMLVSSIVGYLINTHILTKKISFAGYSATKWGKLDINNVLSVISDLLSLFGWQENSPILSIDGIANVLGLAVGIGIIYFLVKLLLSNKECDIEQRFIIVYIGVAFTICTLTFSQTQSVYNASYWIPVLPFLFLIFILGIEKIVKERNICVYLSATYIFMLLLCSCITMKNPYLSDIPTRLGIYNAVNYLEDNGYTEGYVTFWNSDIITELTNGDIEMWTVDDIDSLHIYDWLQETDHVDNQPNKKFFIIIGLDEYNSTENSLKIKSLDNDIIYRDENYHVYGFESMDQYNKLIGSK